MRFAGCQCRAAARARITISRCPERCTPPVVRARETTMASGRGARAPSSAATVQQALRRGVLAQPPDIADAVATECLQRLAVGETRIQAHLGALAELALGVAWTNGEIHALVPAPEAALPERSSAEHVTGLGTGGDQRVVDPRPHLPGVRQARLRAAHRHRQTVDIEGLPVPPTAGRAQQDQASVRRRPLRAYLHLRPAVEQGFEQR